LAYRDTHYMRSGDYYSSSNYASRLIGDELVLYTPVYANWAKLEDSLPAIRKRSPYAKPVPLVKPQDFHVAEPYRSGRYPLDTLHTVTRCKLADTFDCRASAIAGTWSHSFYVSAEAVYVWTGEAGDPSSEDGRGVPGQLYRIPLAGGRSGAVQVSGSPIDQFSFAEDARAGVLRVLLRGDGSGDGMWEGEVSGGSVALASVPLARFGNGKGSLAQADYRRLPEPKGWRFQNRFVGDYVLYAAGDYGEEEETGKVYAVPLAGGAVQEIAIPHGITRFDRMGYDAIAIGPARGDRLGFSALSLGSTPRLEHFHILAAAGEGETRSQAFFFRPDPGSADGTSGVLGLPITRGQRRDGGEFLGSGSAIAFLRRDMRKLAPLGELAAAPGISRSDNCKASCVDWYGNARPIFTGGRIFALMGYELVEGQLTGSAISERRRASFAP
ncbi:MAG: beta-propeller domain-containing protein, partial [Erythrobacter sp.]|uniref:beta-propeller domain-containing protein n=1 Tax=Erythrobacter sp. TaxID=1042 RepID=UPI0025E1529D